MIHRIDVQMGIRPAGIGACRSKTAGRKPLSDEQNNSERLPGDPVLKIENTQPGKGEETEKGQQLVAPPHEADLEAHASRCQSRTRETACRS
jgi:hypothetical protein